MTNPPTTPIFREEWLDAALEILKPWIHSQTPFLRAKTPVQVAVSVGFPPGTRGPSAGGKFVSAVCFDGSQTEDGRPAIFINPSINDSYDVVGHLIHEYGHALVGHASGHRKGGDFARYCAAVNLHPPLTQTTNGSALNKAISAEVLPSIGKYENVHAKVDLSTRTKQATYQLKGSCRCCGDVFRRSKKHMVALMEAVKLGAPPCQKCFIGHPDCTKLCQQAGGGGSPPQGKDYDFTPMTPPPSAGGGQSGGSSSSQIPPATPAPQPTSPSVDESDSTDSTAPMEIPDCTSCGKTLAGDEAKRAEGDGLCDACATEEEEFEEAQDEKREQARLSAGAGTTDGPDTTKVRDLADLVAFLQKAKRPHTPDVCPLGSGCPQCNEP